MCVWEGVGGMGMDVGTRREWEGGRKRIREGRVGEIR